MFWRFEILLEFGLFSRLWDDLLGREMKKVNGWGATVSGTWSFSGVVVILQGRGHIVICQKSFFIVRKGPKFCSSEFFLRSSSIVICRSNVQPNSFGLMKMLYFLVQSGICDKLGRLRIRSSRRKSRVSPLEIEAPRRYQLSAFLMLTSKFSHHPQPICHTIPSYLP